MLKRNNLPPQNSKANSRFKSICNNNLLNSKRSQVTVFVILAILIVAGLGLYFALKSNILQPSVPKDFKVAYNYYLSCIEENTKNAASIIGQQGGYINNPTFEPGSEYMPFSNQLGFLDLGIPYWYYISGNGIKSEQIPSREKMESELDNYLTQAISICDVSQLTAQGYEFIINDAKVKSNINDNSITLNINQDIVITKGELNWQKSKHETSIKSSLGKFYSTAVKIYDNNKQSQFLENYAVDILRLYAPVDGSEISCSPKLWIVDDVRKDLIVALENNVPATKIKGNYYKDSDDYFVQDIGESVDFDVNFLYLRDWPMKMEVWPTQDGDLMRADPIGLQEGLGLLGFCYVPYHFVYDFSYPVMIQLFSDDEMFQFPVVVSIEKNNPRSPLDAVGLPDVVKQLCEYKNTKIKVETLNTNLEPVDTEIKFQCFDTTCNIGKTSNAILDDYFPQCENGYIIAKAQGYETAKQLFSTISEGSVSVILEKKYELDLDVLSGASPLDTGFALITFTKEGKTNTINYPEMRQVDLTQGEYEIKVHIYSNSNIRLKGSTEVKCIKVPKSGIASLFGATTEKCIDLVIPDQVVGTAVFGY